VEKERLVTIDRFPCHGGIQKRDVAKVTRRNTITVSVQSFCDVSDQQEMVVCHLCRLLATVKDT